METIAYRLATRLDAVAAAHMLRTQGHSAELSSAAVADDGNTVTVRGSSEALRQVPTLVERMFPDATRSHGQSSYG